MNDLLELDCESVSGAVRMQPRYFTNAFSAYASFITYQGSSGHQIDDLVPPADFVAHTTEGLTWAKVVSRLSYILKLEEDWDSYGASRIRPSVAIDALRLILSVRSDFAPTIEPNPTGAVVIEWDSGEDDFVSVLVRTRLTVEFSLNGEEGEFDLYTRSEKDRLNHLVGSLSFAE